MLLRLDYLGVTNAFALLRLPPMGDRDVGGPTSAPLVVPGTADSPIDDVDTFELGVHDQTCDKKDADWSMPLIITRCRPGRSEVEAGTTARRRDRNARLQSEASLPSSNRGIEEDPLPLGSRVAVALALAAYVQDAEHDRWQFTGCDDRMTMTTAHLSAP